MAEYVFRDANGFGCDMSELMDEGGKTIGEYFASNNDDHYGTLHEEIVRCRDCKHMHRVRSWLGMDVDECWLHADRESGALGKERTEPNGFCAWGVRKEDECQ